jgi:hypothetical protein
VNNLTSPLAVHPDSWETDSSLSIHEACDKFDARVDALHRQVAGRQFHRYPAERPTAEEEEEQEEEEEIEEQTVDQTTEDDSDVRGDGGVADSLAAQDARALAMQDPLEQGYDYEEWRRQRFKETCKMARAKDVRWKLIDPTPDGRECDILVIDGREQHLL